MVQERRGPRRTTPFLIPSLIPNMAASMIALRHRMGDVQQTIAGACASGSQAIGEAMRAIRDGVCDWVLAGGAEAVTTPITYSGFEAMRALCLADDPTRAPRPFDAARDGMIVGEGAAAFVLEEESRARARGAPILGRHRRLCHQQRRARPFRHLGRGRRAQHAWGARRCRAHPR